MTGTPTLFVDGVRYDGAWDFYSLLEALERPVAARVKRSARVFASLPASGGMVLLLAAVAALLCANTGLGSRYEAIVRAPFSVGPPEACSRCPWPSGARKGSWRSSSCWSAWRSVAR